MAPKATSSASSAAAADRVPLREPHVVVRVRPLAEEGGHSANGKHVYKRLVSWDNGEIVLDDNVELGDGQRSKAGVLSRPQVYTFARDILGTDANQESVYKSSASELVRSFVQDGYNALLFAYGQTGTGKTHTIFGHTSSWDDVNHEQAGIFPRAVVDIFKELRSKSATTAFVLTASAMEFYMCQCTDLLDGNKPCVIGDDHAPLGLCSVLIESPEDAIQFMTTVRENRTARSTLMNQAGGGHAGSSRSHCAMVLTLRQLDKASGMCLKTTLNIMDMAGAERPSSTGSEHEDAIKAVMDYWRGAPVTVGGQGFIVNYELSGLRTAVVQATEQHKKRKPLVNPKQLGTSFIEYASGCFTGSALLAMIVTLSPAPSCGWETWFSCTYGDDLNKLRAPVAPQAAKPLDAVIEQAEKTATKAAADLAKTPASGPSAKYLPKRTVQARHDAREFELFTMLKGL
mmetsp:Transcript_76160/g.205436  ORF Transcript_76160/g.205436 Transcript_76160/m.205436 type:complete len:458 (-) Transcript_76160:42-1415(-)